MDPVPIPAWALAAILLAALEGSLPLPPPGSFPPDPPPPDPGRPTLQEFAPPVVARERPWSLTALVGRADDARFHEIIRFEGAELLDSYIAGLALNRRVLTIWDHLDWELEASTYLHSGIEDHFELNAAILARWTDLPWDPLLDTSVAFGQGISWASRRPILEEETRQLLHHLIAEVEVSPVRQPALSLVLRVHHRSGVFGLYGASGGTNYLTLGLRYRF